MQLNQSRVVFNPEAHTYHLDGVRLQGITGILSRQLFPKKYDNIPEFVLRRAAERGSFIHANCELVDSLGVTPDCEEAINYIALKSRHGMVACANEYIVSDDTNFASSVDVVFDGKSPSGDTVDLADIKTTSVFDNEYVSWQLSIYGYLFELQNPHLKVGRLYGIWLRGAINELIEVDRKPNEVIELLLESEVQGVQFVNPTPMTVTKSSIPKEYLAIEEQILEIETQAKYWADRKKELTDGVMKEMVKAGVYSWKGNAISFIRKKDSTRKFFDKALFEKDYEGVYDKYLKETKISGSVTLKTN